MLVWTLRDWDRDREPDFEPERRLRDPPPERWLPLVLPLPPMVLAAPLMRTRAAVVVAMAAVCLVAVSLRTELPQLDTGARCECVLPACRERDDTECARPKRPPQVPADAPTHAPASTAPAPLRNDASGGGKGSPAAPYASPAASRAPLTSSHA